jgi:hypothetical protein
MQMSSTNSELGTLQHLLSLAKSHEWRVLNYEWEKSSAHDTELFFVNSENVNRMYSCTEMTPEESTQFTQQ